MNWTFSKPSLCEPPLPDAVMDQCAYAADCEYEDMQVRRGELGNTRVREWYNTFK